MKNLQILLRNGEYCNIKCILRGKTKDEKISDYQVIYESKNDSNEPVYDFLTLSFTEDRGKYLWYWNDEVKKILNVAEQIGYYIPFSHRNRIWVKEQATEKFINLLDAYNQAISDHNEERTEPTHEWDKAKNLADTLKTLRKA